ncbi:MAG: TetR family transcriptional regulator [Lachnospiraceae bacterium]|nr:TetR family transcriptional regulator [Lachnospiraceae bacterium]
MNPKFFDVKKEKQDAIINAALMVFAENGYRKASTDVMVKEAGISKGLLFHYFISKQGVYEFVYDYSIKYMLLELTQTVRRDERDFFSIQRMIELAKTRVMKNYPYMQQFLSSAKFETHPDALRVINESAGVIENTYAGIYKKADMSRFAGPVDQKKIIKLIGWMSDGYIKDKFREGTPDLDEMNAEFASYLSMLRDHFYKDGEKPEVIPEGEPEVERDDSVMDSMREEMLLKPEPEEPVSQLSFEERLALGKKSAYGKAEETAGQAEEAAEQAGGEEVPGTEAEAPADEPEAEVKEPVIDEPVAEEPAAVEKADEEEEPVAEEPHEAPVIKVPVSVTEEADEADSEEADSEVTDSEDTDSKEADSDKEEEEVKEEEPADKDDAVNEDKELKEEKEAVKEEVPKADSATVSMDYFEGGYRIYDGSQPGIGDETYAASPKVVSYVPASDIAFYEESRLGDFSYGTDSRGGRGIPYDSSENIQIFVTDDDEGELSGGDDSFDISDLSEKIMSNTDRETAEIERNRELESMGPAPVLPDFKPDNVKRNNPVSDDDDEDRHIYRPLKF